jgi:hypothetical protein
MGLLSAGLGREAKADDGLASNHGRLVGHGAGVGDGIPYRVGVVAVDLLDMPARGAKALELVVGNRETGRAVDRDRVVIPKAMR